MINSLSERRNARKSPQIGQDKDMGILNDLRTRVQGVNNGLQTGELVRNVIVRHPDDILDLQKMQLFQGLTASGKDIRPYYSEDLKPSGYFHSKDSAARYSAWKLTGIRYPYRANRNPDAPNLYINGKFHDELGVQFASDTVGIVPTTPYSAGIMAKYGINTFGLMPDNWAVIFEQRGAYAELMNEIKQRLYV